ncbi:MAG: glucose-6-phosphate isomerase, partial [Micrococcales bacterium]|nr:glucose-6-phosphate isomerase [Micrococcales bacterium]
MNNPPVDPVTTPAWTALRQHVQQMASSGINLRAWFANQPDRAKQLTFQAADLRVDLSKNLIQDQTISLLVDLAMAVDLPGQIEAMFSGQKINVTEGRAVLHTALRSPKEAVVNVDGRNVMPDVHAVLDAMAAFANQVRSGGWKGHTGKAIEAVVNIGIGGSDLGPVMAYEALKPYSKRDLKVIYVSNVDGTDIAESLLGLNPETTLFIVSSKTFTTQETMANAMS